MNGLTEDNISKVLQKIDHKYYGKYRGVVVDINDPENLGRLKVKIPALLGNEVITGWAMPCFPYGGVADQGFFAVPDIDAGVWIEFEAGDLEYPVWVGTYWSKPGGESGVPKPADSQSPPTSKILKTTKKHVIELADEDGNELIKISEKDGRNEIILNDKGIEIKDENNSVKILTESGIKIIDKNGNELSLISIGVVIKSSSITLGENATQPLVLGNKLISWLAMHTHPSSMGPTGPPVQPAIAADLCSLQNSTL